MRLRRWTRDGAWVPTYGWWPHPDEYSVTVILTPYHAAVAGGKRFEFILRGYAGSADPLWEHEVGCVQLGEQRAVRLEELGVPPPPGPEGGVLEQVGNCLDRGPGSGVPYFTMWIDARGHDGGGYIIPTIPIRGAAKPVQRDDVQVIPGIVVNSDTATEVVLANPLGGAAEATLTVTSVSGLRAESDAFEIAAWSAWRGDLGRHVTKARRLLADDNGVGSLSIRSTHKLLPYFGFRHQGGPVLSMDHAAPIFAGSGFAA